MPEGDLPTTTTTPKDGVIFADQEELLAAASGAAAFTSELLEHANRPENDAEVRELVSLGAEGLLYALSQLRTPDTIEHDAIVALGRLADAHAERRAAEMREFEATVARERT